MTAIEDGVQQRAVAFQLTRTVEEQLRGTGATEELVGVPRLPGPWTEPPAGATGAPLTYAFNGKQYIVVAVGGRAHAPEFVALSLP